MSTKTKYDIRLNPTTDEDILHNRQQWANALLSTEFEQSRDTLHDLFGYCCLGVFAEIVPGGSFDEDGYYTNDVVMDGLDAIQTELNLPMRKLLRMTRSDQTAFVLWNDDQHAPFTWIGERVREWTRIVSNTEVMSSETVRTVENKLYEVDPILDDEDDEEDN